MHISELVSSVSFIQKMLVDEVLVQSYDQLANFLRQARSQPSESVSQNIQELKSVIIKAHERIGKLPLGVGQRKILDDIGALELLGKTAVIKLNKIFDDYSADPNGAALEIQAMSSSLTELSTRITNLESSLGSLLKIETEVLEENEGTITLFFKEQVNVETIGDLKKCSDTWIKIIRNFCELADEPASDPRIISIEKGSLILQLAVIATVVLAVADGVHKILGVYERILDIRKKALEIKELKLGNKEVAKLLEKEAENELELYAESIAQDLVEGFPAKDKDHKSEIKSKIKVSLKEIYVFVDKGGAIDFSLPEESVVDEKVAQLVNDTIQSVRQTESRIIQLKMIEDKK